MSASNENPAGGPQAPGTPAGGDAPKPLGGAGSFAPMVMGPPSGSFAPQVMGPPSGSFAPQVMGPPSGSFAPQVMPVAPKPEPAEAAPPISSPFAPSGQDAALVAAFAGEAAEAGPAPPAMLAPMGASPAAANGEAAPGGIVATPAAAGLGDPPAEAAPASGRSADDELAASPWNRANNPGLNRDLLPSAMVAAAPEPPAASKKAVKAPALEEPSRTPWIIVGLLVVVAIAGGVAVFMIQGQRASSGGPIAVPAGRQTSTSSDDTPVDSAAPSVKATATAVVAPRPLPTYRPGPLKAPTARPPTDDPYNDVGSSGGRPRNATPAPTSTAAKGRIFGSDPY